MSPPPPSWLRAAPAAEVALRGARGVPGGSGASGAGRWERRRSGGWEWGREWRWPVSPEGRRCGEVSDGPCDGEAVRGPPAAGCGGTVRDVPWRVLSVVSVSPARGFRGDSSDPQNGSGSAVLALAGLGIVSVTQAGLGQACPRAGAAGQSLPCSRAMVSGLGAEVAPVPARGVCVSPAAAG